MHEKRRKSLFIECLNEPLVSVLNKLMQLSQNSEVLASFYSLVLGYPKMGGKMKQTCGPQMAACSLEDRLLRNRDSTVDAEWVADGRHSEVCSMNE